MEKDLVVIIDKNARRNLENIGFRYFHTGQKRNDKKYLIKNPLGDLIEVKGTLVRKHNLGTHTEESLYMELTKDCQFKCGPCGAKDHRISRGLENVVREDARYITPEFSEKLAATFTDSKRIFERLVFYGGGEPLINPKKFSELHKIFKNAHNTIATVLTNGYSIPLDEGSFVKFIQEAGISGNDNIAVTLSKFHIGQYQAAGKNPSEVIPKLYDLFSKHGLLFHFKDLEANGGNFVRDYIRSNISHKKAALILGKFAPIELNGHRDPCSQAQEGAITVEGKFYHDCFEIFRNPKNYYGIVGLLIKKLT